MREMEGIAIKVTPHLTSHKPFLNALTLERHGLLWLQSQPSADLKAVEVDLQELHLHYTAYSGHEEKNK